MIAVTKQVVAPERGRWQLYLVTSVVIGLAGLPLGPLVMTPAYVALQPQLGPMTLIAVEMLFALLIDFPLATLTAAVVTRVGRALSPWIASLALSDVFPQAVAAASAQFGPVTFGLMGFMFVAFDYCLCLLGGIAGFYAGKLLKRRGASE